MPGILINFVCLFRLGVWRKLSGTIFKGPGEAWQDESRQDDGRGRQVHELLRTAEACHPNTSRQTLSRGGNVPRQSHWRHLQDGQKNGKGFYILGLFFIYFQAFQTTVQILQQINVVHSVGIRTNNLLIVIPLT